MPKTLEGRPSLFRGEPQQPKRYRVQGVLSAEGGRMFDKVRARLLARTPTQTSISDADVIEAAVRHYAQQV